MLEDSTPITFAAFTNQKEELEPSPIRSLPILIARKLNGLDLYSSDEDLEAIRELLDLDQEERVVTDEEVQELKKLENKLLEYQKMNKKQAENMEERGKFSIWFCVLFPLPVFLSAFIIGLIPEFEPVGDFILLLTSWPTKLIAVVILYYFYGFDLGFESGTPESDQTQMLKDEDDGWQDSMTSTEFQSRQKALVNGWDQLQTEKVDHVILKFFCSIAILLNLLYLFIIAVSTLVFKQKSNSFDSVSFSSEPELIFFFIDFIFNISLILLFCVRLLVEILF